MILTKYDKTWTIRDYAERDYYKRRRRSFRYVSVKAVECLEKAGINTLGDLCVRSEADLKVLFKKLRIGDTAADALLAKRDALIDFDYRPGARRPLDHVPLPESIQVESEDTERRVIWSSTSVWMTPEVLRTVGRVLFNAAKGGDLAAQEALEAISPSLDSLRESVASMEEIDPIADAVVWNESDDVGFEIRMPADRPSNWLFKRVYRRWDATIDGVPVSVIMQYNGQHCSNRYAAIAWLDSDHPTELTTDSRLFWCKRRAVHSALRLKPAIEAVNIVGAIRLDGEVKPPTQVGNTRLLSAPSSP
jgi:hypothetical protein